MEAERLADRAPIGLKAPKGAAQATLDEMVKQLYKKRNRNTVRTKYWEYKHLLKDFGISLPPELSTINVVLGWPALAVTSLSNRITFDGFSTIDDNDDMGLGHLLEDAMFDLTLPQAVTSALVQSCAFLIATPGTDDEPDVVLTAKPATHATGIWNARIGTLTDALSILEEDKNGKATSIAWYSRTHVTTYKKITDIKWNTETQPNRTRRCWAALLPYQPELTRPFGRSRISRPVMALTDGAMRVLARSESHAEFFASPQRWAMGVDEGIFSEGRWKAVMSHMLALGPDEDGNIPTTGQYPQSNMTPHFEHLRALAALFASETALPLDAMGIVYANPSSAEAILAAKENLVVQAQTTERIWGAQLRRLATTAVMIRDNLDTPPDQLSGIRAKWLNPATPSVVTAADAMSKFIASFPWAANSSVALESFGFTEAQVLQLLAEKRRSEGATALAQLLATASAPDISTAAPAPMENPNADSQEIATGGSDSPPDASAMKATFEALGMAVRAGVEPADAARRLGLDDVKFTGLQPVSLRDPGAS